jgi:hypothetical protein
VFATLASSPVLFNPRQSSSSLPRRRRQRASVGARHDLRARLPPARLAPSRLPPAGAQRASAPAGAARLPNHRAVGESNLPAPAARAAGVRPAGAPAAGARPAGARPAGARPAGVRPAGARGWRPLARSERPHPRLPNHRAVGESNLPAPAARAALPRVAALTSRGWPRAGARPAGTLAAGAARRAESVRGRGCRAAADPPRRWRTSPRQPPARRSLGSPRLRRGGGRGWRPRLPPAGWRLAPRGTRMPPHAQLGLAADFHGGARV